MIRFSLLLVVMAFSLFDLETQAATLKIVDCKLDIRGQPRGHLKLTVDNSRKLVGWSGILGGRLEKATNLKIFNIEPVGKDFSQALVSVNNYRDTGINPARATHWQRVFINGNSDFNANIYKVFGVNGEFIGWLGSAIVLSGCYQD